MKMKTYEVTTTVTITRKHLVEADGEETAKEQAEGLIVHWLLFNIEWIVANWLDLDQQAVEITSPTDEAKQYA